MGAPIAGLSHIKRFMLGGNARFTLRSLKTGERRTFEVELCPEQGDVANPRHFVRLLTGPDNGCDYKYLGLLIDGVRLEFKLNRQNWGADAAAALVWMLEKISDDCLQPLCAAQANFDAQAEFWHEGRCSRCGRALTTPESIAVGIGPKCLERGM